MKPKGAGENQQGSHATPAQTTGNGQELSRTSSARTVVEDQTQPAGTAKKSGKGGLLAEGHRRLKRGERLADGTQVLSEADCYDELGFSFPSWKKWWILTVIFLLQCSMNLNAGIYGSALTQFQEEWGLTAQVARLGSGLFLICYAFGCELWAPFSEELGRWPILQGSLFLVNIWALACALAPNYPALVIFRVLQGFSSAGGSVTLGIVADLYEPEHQGKAVAYVVFSSVGGSVLGPIIGAFQARFLSWHWNFWLQLIFGGAVQILHLFTVPETKASVLMNKIVKKRRANGEKVYAPDELKDSKWNTWDLLRVMGRPFIMYATEPIVLCLSLLSGFADALIFTFLESYGPIFKQWGFGTIANGLAFIPIAIGYCISYASFIPFINRNEKEMAESPDTFQPEKKLYWLLYTAPLLSIGLFGFAWTSLGPPHVHWIAPLIFSALIGIANYAIYMATIDYMIHAYGPYSASATGGNGFSRDFLAGIATFYATPLYTNLGNSHPLEWGSTVLAFLAILVTIPIYIFYRYGPQIRQRSKFALVLEGDRKALQSDLQSEKAKKSQTTA